ncbi:MAG: hypothetical protein WCT37_04360, partial [Patescibacteria group bacterium]
ENLAGFIVLSGVIFAPLPTAYVLFWLAVFLLFYYGARWGIKQTGNAAAVTVALLLWPLAKSMGFA